MSPSSREGRLLGALLLQPNRRVPLDRLVDYIYGAGPPQTARRQVENRLALLRRRLKEWGVSARLDRVDSGFQLHVAPDEVDASVFDRLAAEAHADLARGDGSGAAMRMRAALDLWRGDVLEGMQLGNFAPAGARLDMHRQQAYESWFEAELLAGRPTAVLAPLFEKVQEQPANEHLVGLLMQALDACGRKTEALTAYRRTWKLLADEHGVEPRPELTALHQSILNGDAHASAAIATLPVGIAPAAGSDGAEDNDGAGDIDGAAGSEAAETALRAVLAGLELIRGGLAGVLSQLPRQLPQPRVVDSAGWRPGHLGAQTASRPAEDPLMQPLLHGSRRPAD